MNSVWIEKMTCCEGCGSITYLDCAQKVNSAPKTMKRPHFKIRCIFNLRELGAYRFHQIIRDTITTKTKIYGRETTTTTTICRYFAMVNQWHHNPPFDKKNLGTLFFLSVRATEETLLCYEHCFVLFD